VKIPVAYLTAKDPRICKKAEFIFSLNLLLVCIKELIRNEILVLDSKVAGFFIATLEG
jgi:hypothetical protein